MSRQQRRREDAGFSMIELLVTIVIAGIVFAAMFGLFITVYHRTSGDRLRVSATNIAQDRIEQIRLLKYSDITAANLNYAPQPPSPFGDGRFGPTYTQVGESVPYKIAYEVTPLNIANPKQNAKFVKVTVARPGRDGYKTTADTVIENPEPGGTMVSDAEPTNLKMVVWFDNWKYVKSPGVTITRIQTNVTPNVTVSLGSKMPPSAYPNECEWTGLTGGPNYTYQITCYSSKATYEMNAPPFRLWTDGRMKFDTYPGGD